MGNEFIGATDPYCHDSRECFAAVVFRGKRKCTVLQKTDPYDGMCAFCKPEARKTNGKTKKKEKNYYVVED